MAGDMTVYGQRDKVKLIREDAQGNRQVIPLNLNDADIIVSPYYYLQQNDVVYVTPNKTKAKNAGISNSTTIWFSVVGTLGLTRQPDSNHCQINRIMKEDLYDDLYTWKKKKKRLILKRFFLNIPFIGLGSWHAFCYVMAGAWLYLRYIRAGIQHLGVRHHQRQ